MKQYLDHSLYIPLLLEILFPDLDLTPIEEAVMFHITCSSRRMGLGEKMLAVARACVRQVIVPEHIQCCGFAGGPRSATMGANLSAQVLVDCRHGFSNNRIGEMELRQHAGIPCHGIQSLFDRPAK